MKSWTPDIDPATIPDKVLARSERGRRNAGRRKVARSGVLWKKHTAKPRAAGAKPAWTGAPWKGLNRNKRMETTMEQTQQYENRSALRSDRSMVVESAHL